MIGRQPKWTLRVIHIPSGIEVIRTSDHFRNQHNARESAIRYLKSKLAFTNKNTSDEDFSYDYNVPDDNLYPRELKEFRREVE